MEGIVDVSANKVLNFAEDYRIVLTPQSHQIGFGLPGIWLLEDVVEVAVNIEQHPCS
jgi:hypothetical protein